MASNWEAIINRGSPCGEQIMDPGAGNNAFSYSIYPNPSSGFLSIEYLSLSANNQALNIYDVTGRLVYKDLLSPSSFSTTKTMNLNHLPAGIYFLVFPNEGEEMVERIAIFPTN